MKVPRETNGFVQPEHCSPFWIIIAYLRTENAWPIYPLGETLTSDPITNDDVWGLGTALGKKSINKSTSLIQVRLKVAFRDECFLSATVKRPLGV